MGEQEPAGCRERLAGRCICMFLVQDDGDRRSAMWLAADPPDDYLVRAHYNRWG
jgi:hypothetical protein